MRVGTKITYPYRLLIALWIHGKTYLVVAFFLLILIASARGFSTLEYDTFSNGSGCNGGLYSCGTEYDRIVDTGGTIRVNLTGTDTSATYVCATLIQGANATTETCLIRPTVNLTVCDSFPAVAAADKSHFYNCTSGLSSCGWNGLAAAPSFAVASPNDWQMNTSFVQRTDWIFISYQCNGTFVAVQNTELSMYAIDTKGVVCSGDSYQSVAHILGNYTPLSPEQSCPAATFCDPTRAANFTTSLNITGDFCTPGCDDAVQNSDESDVDYGGAVCGNCSTIGKPSDEFYVFAKELQTSERGPLRPTSPFNSTLYCENGRTLGSASIGVFFILFFISIVSVLVLVGAILGLGVFIIIPIGRFLRSKYRKRKQGT